MPSTQVFFSLLLFIWVRTLVVGKSSFDSLHEGAFLHPLLYPLSHYSFVVGLVEESKMTLNISWSPSKLVFA